jgi:predicted nucleic acid-binding protein
VSWVVDTCVLIDIAEGDPQFSRRSAQLLDHRRSAGLLVAPVSYIELAPRFHGVETAQNEFLEAIGVHWSEPWIWPDTVVAHRAWCDYMLKRRRGQERKRPIADILIGAFASRFDGLVTRNEKDFRLLFPQLLIDKPK